MNLSLGLRIVLARKEIGLSQIHLAKRLGTTPSVVNHWEKDKFVPSAMSMGKLIKVLGKPQSYFDKKDKVMQITEPSAAYGAEINSAKLPIVNKIPADPTEIKQEDLQGYISLPRHIFPGAVFAVKAAKKMLNTAKISENDYCIITPQTSRRAGAIAVVKSNGEFTLTDKPARKGQAVTGHVAGILKKL